MIPPRIDHRRVLHCQIVTLLTWACGLALCGPNRYGELKRAVRGVSDKVLIQQLKELEADDVVKRTDYKEVPPRLDYALTPLGRSLAEALVPLCTWGSENMAEVSRIFAERDAWRNGKAS
ncbi:helix-turn-helix domain-containing protein [Bradyrhizobium sp. Arg237L]|uniref:winged helix-turn-helix transcriptional regulator n=1 Tax=Bradyrhizobium sp. Arg237L TaxID=3003352 RepID=UPI00249F21AD|nr:helix-turn-helix domain-containing protein [Bradyrhizobium sp. Arg237L]MDI4231421.1 helix-turn-helix domain-containing protein [Bradyrhizobium sp. Arg237L]